MRIEAAAGRLPLPPGWIDEPLLPEPVRFSAGRRSARVRVEVTFGRRGRRLLPPPALVLRDPFGLAQRVVTGGEPDELLVLPRIFPVTATAGGEDSEHAHARASLTAAAETEIDGLRPHREGAPASRIHWPAFARGAGLMERKLISEADSRPLDRARPARAGVARGARRGGPRRRLADRALRQARRLRAAAARRPPRARDRARPARVAAGARAARARRRAHRPGADGRAEPARADRVRVRPHRRPRPARARPHARRLPARDPRRAAEPARGDRGRRLPRLRRRAHRQRGADGDGGGARRDERRGPRHRAARHGPGAAARRARRRPARARTCCARPGRCCRSRSPAARPSSRSPRSARCTGWRCSSRPRRRAPGTRSAPACWRWPALLGAARLHGALRWAGGGRHQPGRRSCSPSSPPASPTRCCGPSNWDALASGIERGISALPGARVPYRGIDQWTRIVIPLGGTMLTVLAALDRVLAAARGAPASRSPRSSCS